MTAVWDGDTGTITITASTSSGPVNLSGTTTRTVIARNKRTKAATELSITSEDLPIGVVTADAGPLAEGVYEVVLRAADATTTATYPSADSGPEVLTVRAALDAPV